MLHGESQFLILKKNGAEFIREVDVYKNLTTLKSYKENNRELSEFFNYCKWRPHIPKQESVDTYMNYMYYTKCILIELKHNDVISIFHSV